MNINWYPGHMKKTIEDIERKKLITDFCIEIIDARIPFSSSNPLLNEVIKGKKKLIIFNKSDLCDENMTSKWISHYKSNDINVLKYNATKPNVNAVIKASMELMAEEIKKFNDKGINHGALKAMVVGIPNSGKSTFINGISGRKSAKTGNTPGITKTNQWIRLNKNLHLLDTPGVLWHKFPENVGINLAFTGAIKDEIMDRETLGLKLIERLNSIDKNILKSRYGVDTEKKPIEIMEDIGKKRGALLRGALIDYEKVSSIVLDEFRKGVLGRITLEDIWLSQPMKKTIEKREVN